MTGLPSTISTIVLGVTNIPQSIAFYRDTLGLKLSGQSPESAFIAAGGITLFLSVPLGRKRAPLAGAMEIVFSVDSINEAKTVLSQRGGKFINEPREVTPGSWTTTLADPDGHYITVFGPL
jgi:predicted enzyme related to lactoylglutathione lyase